LHAKRFRPIHTAVVLGCLACLAMPAYGALRTYTSDSAAMTNVRAAVTAAEAYAAGTGQYTGIDGHRLRRQTPRIDGHLRAVAVNGGFAYCLEDSVGGIVYDYVGGVPGGALAAGAAPARLQRGPCSHAVGAPAA